MKLESHAPRHALRTACSSAKRGIFQNRTFEPGDFVILRPSKSRTASPLFKGPLTPGKRIETHKGIITHDQIIGKHVRDTIETATTRGKEDSQYRLHTVQLADYVSNSRRLVTPIYPADANLIVSLLDLHPEAKEANDLGDNEPKLEILEAGTGHGSLTLHLSRAIHGANGRAPKASSFEDPEAHAAALETWKGQRRAIIHTIDVSPRYSSHASKTVRAFRQGQYYSNIDFYAADVSEWLRSTLPSRSNEPFLSHAFLDLPSADKHLATVASALRVDGTLIVFNPSITQITACALLVKKEGIPLELDRVLELGVNGGSGGRDWDVRAVKPRAAIKAENDRKEVMDGDTYPRGEEKVESDGQDSGVELERESERQQEHSEQVVDTAEKKPHSEEDEWYTVCRPKVGERVIGGGFLAVFKKQRLGD